MQHIPLSLVGRKVASHYAREKALYACRVFHVIRKPIVQHLMCLGEAFADYFNLMCSAGNIIFWPVGVND
jgi:hypothetical protein